MKDLLLTSYKAQCSYMSRNLHSKIQRDDFIWITDLIYKTAYSGFETPQQVYDVISGTHDFPGKNLAFDIYKETYDNLERRFEGYESTDPIERIL